VPQNNVFVYFRYDEKETVMVVLNANESDQEIELSRFSEALKNFKEGKEIISGNNFTLQKTLNIPAKSSMIFELN
jgi:hypothetical protein